NELLRQHAQRETFTALQGAWRLDDAAAAYRVQDAYVAQLARQRTTDVCGYKIALTTPAMREMVGYDDSIAGCLLRDRVIASGAQIVAAGYGRLILEFEIAFRIADDLPSSAVPWSRVSIFNHVACAFPALEIVDDRGADYRTLRQSILTLAADNAWNAGLVLGAPVRGLTPDALEQVEGVAWLDGKEVGRGTGRDVMGHPLDALAWLANHLQTRGRSLRKGDLVTTGSLVKSQFPEAGCSVRFELGALGSVRLQID
ncbi:MAG: hydratase, partial [Comamonadaceae bacterium]